MAPPARPRSGLTMGDLTKRFGSVALVGLHRGRGCDRHGSCPATDPSTADTAKAVRPGYGVGRHDAQRPRDLCDMGAVARACGPSGRQGSHRILGGGLPLRSRRGQQTRRDRTVSARRTCRLARPILHCESADETSGRSECPRARNARSSRGTAMMAMLESIGARKLAVLAVALALALSATGCATGPLGSHGTDYIPAFDAPYQGDG